MSFGSGQVLEVPASKGNCVTQEQGAITVLAILKSKKNGNKMILNQNH